MPTDVEVTDPLISIFVPVPRRSVLGTCQVCHGAAGPRGEGGHYPRCWSCQQIWHPLPDRKVCLVVPISLVHTSESQLYASLRDYKNPYLEKGARGRHSLLLAATLQRFIRLHQKCIEDAAGAPWDTIAVVPSTTTGRSGPHPLEEVLCLSPLLKPQLRRELLTYTGEGIGHNQPNPRAFRVHHEASGRSILLVDDTFTTGARLHSAAVAIASSGATVVAAVPIGRVISTGDPDHRWRDEFWRQQRPRPFSFDTCCLEP